MTESDTGEPSVTVRRTIDASTERAFVAWLDPAEVTEWMFPSDTDEIVAVDVEPRVGGTFSFVVRRHDDEIDHVGRYLEIDRPERLAFTWRIAGDDGTDRVTVDISAGPSGCEVTLTHVLAPEWADYADRTAEAWTTMLEALAGHLEDEDR